MKITLSTLQNAISKSKLIHLSPEKLRVARNTALPEIDDTDDRSLYLESFPAESDHDSLRRLYSKYGKVLHVSLPRDSHREFKGFGFIEFATIEAMEEAIRQGDGIRKTDWLKQRKQLQEKIQLLKTGKTFYTKGLLLRLSKIALDESKQQLKDRVEAIVPVGFIDTTFQTTNGTVIVRFMSKTHTAIAQSQLDSTDILTGEEEAEYWTRCVEKQYSLKRKVF